VDRRAHERALDDRALLERAGQRVALEALQTGPQADVHRRRVLRLESGDELQRARDRDARALEQQLAGEQRPVELAAAERADRSER
jgi:hypothetical protein